MTLTEAMDELNDKNMEIAALHEKIEKLEELNLKAFEANTDMMNYIRQLEDLNKAKRIQKI